MEEFYRKGNCSAWLFLTAKVFASKGRKGRKGRKERKENQEYFASFAVFAVKILPTPEILEAANSLQTEQYFRTQIHTDEHRLKIF